jgi:hypothetical protein
MALAYADILTFAQALTSTGRTRGRSRARAAPRRLSLLPHQVQ